MLKLYKYKNIVDYLQVDEETGKLIHYHVYFKLELGESNIKQYLIEWSDEILSNRIKHESYNIWITSHEHELVLLILREVLRIPYLKMLIIKNTFYKYNFSNKVISEYEWLKKRSVKKKFLFILSQLFKEERNIINSFEKIFDEGFSLQGIVNINDNLKFLRKKIKLKVHFILITIL